MYHTEMGSFGDPYAYNEIAELVSDEDDFDLDQPLMLLPIVLAQLLAEFLWNCSFALLTIFIINFFQ